ncbi:MAG: hypothetical protein KA331_05600 [Acinetobacter sp.]|mgnify:FL=1|nr:hypothetical protein [Acinetobacter sp.]MBP6353264.1 hypothetical protein [Acinetobacter sp.]
MIQLQIQHEQGLFRQFWSFICNEGLPCLFIILMLGNGLFFSYAIISNNQAAPFTVQSEAQPEVVEVKSLHRDLR